jgi:hypothetical protein
MIKFSRIRLAMVTFFIVMTFLTLLIVTPLAAASSAASPCASVALRSVTVRSVVEVDASAGELSLADLLAPDTCASVLSAARRVRLGGVPLAGSVRIFDADEVRALLNGLFRNANAVRSESAAATMPERIPDRIPDRIIVRRAGNRSSCAELRERILTSWRPPQKNSAIHDDIEEKTVARPPSRLAMDCAAANFIPPDAPLDLSHTAWNPALDSWEISVRCVHAADCVPFLVRLRADDLGTSPAHSAATLAISQHAASPESQMSAGRRPLVRRGQSAILLWDGNGIRVVARVVCLDSGGPGQAVRARFLESGSVVRAIVVQAGELRVAS